MRSFALIVGLTSVAVGSDASAMPGLGERVIAVGTIVNVDEKNSSFDILEIDSGRTNYTKPIPVLMVIRHDNGSSYQCTWDDLRKISASGRITSLVVDPSDPSVIYFNLTTR